LLPAAFFACPGGTFPDPEEELVTLQLVSKSPANIAAHVHLRNPIVFIGDVFSKLGIIMAGYAPSCSFVG